MNKYLGFFVFLTAITIYSHPSKAAEFIPLAGSLPVNSFNFRTRAYGVSGNGEYIVGQNRSTSGDRAVLWTLDGSMQSLGGPSDSIPYGVSDDGLVVVGQGPNSIGLEAFRWTSGEVEGLGYLVEDGLVSGAFGISDDGTVIVGNSNSDPGTEAFRWTTETGLIGLGDLPGDIFNSLAFDVSADGSVVVGRSRSTPGSFEAFRWTDEGMEGLGDLPGGIFRSEAFAVSADGLTIVGQSFSSLGEEAFVWTSDGGMKGLGSLSTGNIDSIAYGVSGNGSLIVGKSSPNSPGNGAFIWDELNGMRAVRDVLIDDYNLDLTGWRLEEARGISNDGRIIVGWGHNPDNKEQAWVVIIPEPKSYLLAILGFLSLLVFRRKQKR